MARFDLTESDLRSYDPNTEVPSDFSDFWRRTIDSARSLAWPTIIEQVEGFDLVDVFDIRFAGYGGDPISAWYLRPAGHHGDLPLVIGYPGYGGGRGLPHHHLAWPCRNVGYLAMDVRGQGGDTPDPHGAGPTVPGFAARGIESRDSYYYRRVFADAVLSVDIALTLPGVDRERVAVSGASQGGGIALAAVGLHAEVAAAIIDVPFLCDFDRAIALTDAFPYAEISRYLARHHGAEDRVLHTLRYFDGTNFARTARSPARFSVGLADTTCPPSTVFAAFNLYAGEKEIDVYRFNGHEGGGSGRWTVHAEFLDLAFAR